MILSQELEFLFIAVTKTGSTAIEKAISQYQDIKTCHKHKKYVSIRNEYPFVDSYFKFAFVRNPWDWAVSWYFYRKDRPNSNNTKNISFKKWIKEKASTAYNPIGIGLSVAQSDFICDEYGVKVDFVGRFENLQEDFNTICDKIAIPRQQLCHLNKSEHEHYSRYYDDETRDLVAQRYAKDIEYFGYEF